VSRAGKIEAAKALLYTPVTSVSIMAKKSP